MISRTHKTFTVIRTAWFAKLPAAFFSYGLILLVLACPLTTHAARQMENLGRGVVAVRSSSSQAFISWRLLGLDPAGIGFNIYRSANGGAPVKLNGSTLTNGCNYTDTTATLTQTNAYHVRPVTNGVEQAASAAWTLRPNAEVGPLFRIALSNPLTNREIHNVWVGDVDGDGEYEFILAWKGIVTGQTQKLQVYKRDGTFLWEVDFGPNSVDPDNIYPTSAAIIAGQWDGTTVYDLDGDGRAEVIVKSANGVTFGNGTTLHCGDDLTQFISILDGQTGAERARVVLPNPWRSINRALGTLFGIGYPDGQRPSLMIHAKNRNPSDSFNLIESAWDFRGGVLTNRWSLQWDGDVGGAPVNSHQMRLVDVDGDGKDELIPGMHAISSNGTLLWNLGTQGVVHGDRFQISDLNPNRPGLEMYGIQQNNNNGLIEYFADAATGQLLWVYSVGTNGWDAARGTAADVDPRYPGMEVWSFNGIRSATGVQITTTNFSWPNLQMWWDGDLLGENLDQTLVEKWDYINEGDARLLTGYHYDASDNSRSVPQFYGDILGDWREEIVYEASNHTQLVVFTTTSTTTNRLYTLPHNPAYRNCLTLKGYYQANLPDYFLGVGMSNPPTPNIIYTPLSSLPSAPSAPTGLSATAVSAPQIDLAWTDNSTNEEGFQIERSTNGVNFGQIWLMGANTTNYSDIGLTSATTYYYRVRSGNLGGQSAYSGIASATTPASIVVTAILPGTSTNSASAPALATSGIFNMNGGNVVVLLVTSENSATTTTIGASFAGQPMIRGVSTNQGAQWAGIFYLANPVTTSGTFEITNNVGSGGLAYSAIALGNASSVVHTAALANTASSGNFDLVYTTQAKGGFVFGAVVNNGFSASRPGPAYVSGEADQFLYPTTIVGSSGHLHAYGDVPAAGIYTNTYAIINQTGPRNVFVTLAFEASNMVTPTPPLILETYVDGANLVFSGSSGPANWTYFVLTATNLNVPIWTPVATNQFDTIGNFFLTLTNAVNPVLPQTFYRLRLQ
jgi:rhamnogalacturonan endolyase